MDQTPSSKPFIDPALLADLNEESKIITGVVDISQFNLDLLELYKNKTVASLGMIRDEIIGKSVSISGLERWTRGISTGSRVLLNRRFPGTPHDNPVTVKALLNVTSGRDFGEILWEHGETLSDTIFLVLLGTVSYATMIDGVMHVGASRAGDYSVFPKGRKVTLTLDGRTAILILEKHSYIHEL